MEKLKQIWSVVWSHIVSFGKLLKKWFTEEGAEQQKAQITKVVQEKKEKSKIRLRKKSAKKSTKKNKK
jgi:hypothetical protein